MTDAAATRLAAKLKTPLQIGQHLGARVRGGVRGRRQAHHGLVVTPVPKVPIWKACDFNVLAHTFAHISLISHENQLFIAICAID